MKRFVDETGNVYGMLTVLSYAGSTKWNTAKFLCKCECGNTKVIDGTNLRRTKLPTRSCGCNGGPKIKQQINMNPKDRTVYRAKINRIKFCYKLSEQNLRDMMDIQKGCCAICDETLVDPNIDRDYHIDHCHTSNNLRNLLCAKCNLALGLFRDDVHILERAIEYLNLHK